MAEQDQNQADDSDTPGPNTGPMTEESNSGRPLWRRLGLAAVNLWLAYHLFAIVAAPASVMPSSRLQRQSWNWVGRYLQALYLNHGWHFFSPEPSRSTLLRYTLEHPDGSTVTRQLPNRTIQPRLLYHRYFMLTEFLGRYPPEQLTIWHETYARQLCRQSGAVRVELSRVYHELPLAERILAGGKLDDPEFFTEEPIGVFESSEL
jgi:hypothetical protein